MPELPEVEIYSRYFAGHALQQTIERVRVRDDRILGDIRKEKFASTFRGRMFTQVRRHDEPRFARVVFDFDNDSHLAFEDMRLFGIADVTPDPDVFIAGHRLGPDPLDPSFTLRKFRALVAHRRGAVKSLLMSQEIIAGIGNLYADETLFQTSIHPRRAVDRLSDVEVKAIFAAMRRILREAIARKIRHAGYPPRYLIHHREEGDRCPRCGGAIQRSVVFGRTTYFCGKHQK